MNNLPLVSVLMTSYNRQKYIAESIESVLASTYINFELIIVDDVSNDATVEVAKQYAAKDDRIKIYVNDKNLGDYSNRNKAAGYAVGKYVKYLDSDDIIYPWGLEVMVRCMEQYPEAGFGLISWGLKFNTRLPQSFNPASAYYQYCFKGSMILAGPSLSIIKTAAFNEIGGFSGQQFIGDTELWLNLSTKYSMLALPADLVWWREHEDQQIKQEYSNTKVESNRFHLYKNKLQDARCPLPIEYSNIAVRNLKNRYCRNLFQYLFRGEFKRTGRLYKEFGLGFTDYIKSFKSNKYPKAL